MSIKNHSQSVFVLTLYLIFVLLTFVFLTSGAAVYSTITEKMDQNYDIRTALSYVSTKIQQSEGAGAVYTEEREGTSVLVTEETEENTVYQSHIYFKDGYMWEIYIEKGMDFTLEDGDKIIELGHFEAEVENNLATATVTSRNGKTSSLSVFVRE